MEDIGLDEAFLDITNSTEPPEHIARAIKNRIKEQTALTCSVGIGPNKLLAKISSDLEKPDGLTRLDHKDIPTRVWPLAVRKLWGVGPKTEIRLAKLGVTTIGDLAALPLEKLLREFGEAHGRYLHNASRGIDETPLQTRRKRKSISQEVTFQQDTEDIDTLTHVLNALSRDAVARLRQYHYMARTISLKLRFNNFETHTRSFTLTQASDDINTIEQAARQCLDRIVICRLVRLIGVRLSHLETRKEHHNESQINHKPVVS
jgi:DNA polymerase-4